jgi:hypothetical protein
MYLVCDLSARKNGEDVTGERDLAGVCVCSPSVAHSASADLVLCGLTDGIQILAAG